MEKTNIIENSIVALENTLGLSITVIDNAGAFHTNLGIAIFNSERQSHRKNQVCDIGFCKKCPGHCRYVMNEKCAKLQEPFVETCWKGVSEIVVPLQQGGIHYGMLYASSWRQTKSLPPAGLPKNFYPIYNKLPLIPESDKIIELKNILNVFATGILTLLKE